MSTNKVQITKEELENIYDITDEVPKESEEVQTPVDEATKESEETVLTEQEQIMDDKFHEEYNIDEEKNA